MSNYLGKANNPNTGNLEDCEFLDDFYGKRQYAVRFKDGTTYPESEVEGQPMNEHKHEPWEENKEIVTFIKWYFGKSEHWSVHDLIRVNLMGRRLLVILTNQTSYKYHEGYKQGRFDQKIEGNTANAERILAYIRTETLKVNGEEVHKLQLEEILKEAAARLIMKP